MNLNQANTKKENILKMTGDMHREGKEPRRTGCIDPLENQESIRIELDTSEKLERELNKKIEEQQLLLEKEKVSENETMQRAENIHLTLANLEQKMNLFWKIFPAYMRRNG